MRRLHKRIYLDYAATTPVDSTVIKAMAPYWSGHFGNPSSLYQGGREAKNAIEQARANIAGILQCSANEIVFTSGGTESANLALVGTASAYRMKTKKRGHIIISAVEHHAVLNTAEALKEDGWKVSIAPVNNSGVIDLGKLKQLIKKDTVVISVMYANNEIGTIQPIAEIGRWLAGLNKARTTKKLTRILFHTDACQAGGALDLNVNALGVDMLTLNASKLYGPKGVGLLYIKAGTMINPIQFGGEQERGIRSGTENTPGIIGLSTALTLAQKNRIKENKRLRMLQQYLNDRLTKKVKGFIMNGPDIKTNYSLNNGQPVRLANNLNVAFEGVEGEALMLYLDAEGIEVSTGSACASASEEPSHVLLAIGVPKRKAYNAIRITMGRSTTKGELDYLIDRLAKLVPMIRGMNQS